MFIENDFMLIQAMKFCCKESNKKFILKYNLLISALYILAAFSISSCVSLNSPNPEKKMKAVNKIENEYYLETIALSDIYTKDICLAAINKINNPYYLKDIALQANSDEIGVAAVSRLSDPKELTVIALRAKLKNVCLAAVSKITNPVNLIEITIDANKQEVCYAALNRIKNETDLAEIAKKTDDGPYDEQKIGVEAVKRIKDQDILSSLVNTISSKIILRTVLDKIIDQNIIIDKAKSGNKQALSRITDQNTLADIAIWIADENHNDDDAEQIVHNRIFDQSVLFKVAMAYREVESKGYQAAINKIYDYDLLMKIVNSHDDKLSDYWRQEYTIYSLWKRGYQKALLDISLNHYDSCIRIKAFNKLNDSTLNEIVKSTTSPLYLASKIKLKQLTWTETFLKSKIKCSNLSNITRAIEYVNEPKPDIQEIITLCDLYIKHGDENCIPDLLSILILFNSDSLAEMYLNCGNYQLSYETERWALSSHYILVPGGNSSHIRWGEDK